MLVGLFGPQVGRGRLVADAERHVEVSRQLPDLGLVQIAERVDRRGQVAVQRAVAEQQLGLVAGAQHERVVLGRAIEQQDHAGPCHHVAQTESSDIAGYRGERVEDR